MFADYHVHTYYSDDSDYPMEQVVLDAIRMGMDEICFTDHIDYGVKRDWDDPRGILYREGAVGEPENMPLANADCPKVMDEIAQLRKKYGDRITIKAGMEFGMQIHTIPQYERLYQKYPFDFIILSVHEVDDKEFWNQEYQKGKTQEEYVLGYYQNMLKLVQNYKHYSVLGHVDLITRYDRCGMYPFDKIKPIVKEILETVIADGKGIEVNTSYKRYLLPDLTPSRDILLLYKELGGKIVTIGSDSHKKEHLGSYMQEAKEELRKLGFTQYCTYEKMQPIYHKL